MPVVACADKGGHRRWQNERVSVPGQSVGADTASQGSSHRPKLDGYSGFRFTVEKTVSVSDMVHYRGDADRQALSAGAGQEGTVASLPAWPNAGRSVVPIPPDVRSYALPAELVRRLPPPPQQHRYVRVGADVLLIAAGSAMVIDALEDIDALTRLGARHC